MDTSRLPLHVSEMFDDFIKDANDRRVADCRIDGETTQESIVTAAYLVRAANAMPRLVEACEQVIADAGPLNPEDFSEGIVIPEETYDVIVSALAAAKGDSDA